MQDVYLQQIAEEFINLDDGLVSGFKATVRVPPFPEVYRILRSQC